jgi:hypothetical protein
VLHYGVIHSTAQFCATVTGIDRQTSLWRDAVRTNAVVAKRARTGAIAQVNPNPGVMSIRFVALMSIAVSFDRDGGGMCCQLADAGEFTASPQINTPAPAELAELRHSR